MIFGINAKVTFPGNRIYTVTKFDAHVFFFKHLALKCRNTITCVAELAQSLELQVHIVTVFCRFQSCSKVQQTTDKIYPRLTLVTVR